jgi:hypothetical protein
MRRTPLLLVFLFLLTAQTGHAVALPPCTDALGMDIIPLSNGIATYCVSDYGWSDTWFVGSSPGIYDPRFDVFSGDDSPNLHFGILGGDHWTTVSGFGWISPIMDGGALTPSMLTFSPWTVVTAEHYTGATSAESVVAHPRGIQATIVTTLNPVSQEVTQRFTFLNTTSALTFTDIVFADYFNYHPNGSTAENAIKTTINYSPLTGLTATGIDDGTLIASGSMRGERVDDRHGRAVVFPAIDMVQTVTYFDPGDGVPEGPGDVGGGLAWNLPDLAPGASVEFTIFKNSIPLTAVPEPSSLLMLGLPLSAWILRRRLR